MVDNKDLANSVADLIKGASAPQWRCRQELPQGGASEGD